MALPPPDAPFTEEDLQQLAAHGIGQEEAREQLALLRRGPRPVRLVRPISSGDGLVRLPAKLLPGLEQLFRDEARRGRAMKFVPASGAATRMFRAPLACLGRGEPVGAAGLAERAAAGETEAVELARFLDGLDRLPFYPELQRSLAEAGLDAAAVARGADLRPLLEHLLTPRGLDFARRPKALIPFHAYADHVRTPVEEHLAEAAASIADAEGRCRLHFTVSPEDEREVERHCREATARWESRLGVRFLVGLSVQEPATDALACNPAGRPFRDERGRILLRPAGHGALLGNLERCGGDMVLIRNIDNVAPDRLKEEAVRWRAALGGYLVLLQERIFGLLRRLEEEGPDPRLVEEGARLAASELSVTLPPGLESLPEAERTRWVADRLHRPLRVCGMVRAQGEPGGGPFWVAGPEGAPALRIVEDAEIDRAAEEQRSLAAAAGYFHPTDMVCGLRDHRGRPFDLQRFVDPQAVILTEKSHSGRRLLALERPGLWNGGMARWNTVFVEIPLAGFTPVKTVLDLLRPAHQPG